MKCPHCGKENDDKGKSLLTLHNVSNALTYGGTAVAAVCGGATLFGFGPAGIIINSLAAMWQSSIGNVMVGSMFATLQSLGATGTFVTGTYGGGAIAATGIAGKIVEYRSGGVNENRTKESADQESSGDEKSSENNDGERTEETLPLEPNRSEHNIWQCAFCGHRIESLE